MILLTPVEKPDRLPKFRHGQTLLLLGSCFATHMGLRLAAAKFDCDTNPYGTLYNPLSIAAALDEMAGGKVYTAADLFFHGGLWHSPMHHSDFSAPTPDETLRRINTRLSHARERLSRIDGLLLTFGSSYIYKEKESGLVVGNCHKLPESRFVRQRLTVDEIVETYTRLLDRLTHLRPDLQVLLTVSPIRHVRDGLHANQLSKATLLLAADALQTRFSRHVAYFPAYELLMDELRDYRFYADDLVHPSALAVDYVWQRFAESCFPPETRRVVEECARVEEMLNHKPFHPESEAYKRFLEQIMLRIDQLNGKYPYLDFQNERKLCLTRLNTLPKL